MSPIFNRCVIFNTDYDSYHGHPEPMTCPKNTYRKSIALYYYTNAKSNVKKIATNYKSRPKDKFLKRKAIEAADNVVKTGMADEQDIEDFSKYMMDQFYERRQAFYERLNKPRYIKGWTRRNDEVYEKAKKMGS